MNTQMGLAIAVASVVIAVAMLAPFATNADAKRATICQSGPTAGEGPCPGNSAENNPNRCDIVKTGQGGGQGTIKEPCEDE